MVGHKDKHQWAATEGEIVDVRPGRHEHHYMVTARNHLGARVQREVKHRSPQPYPVGSKVMVEISVLNEIRFDPNAPGGDPLIASATVVDQIAEAAAAFDRPGAASGPSFGRMSGIGAAAGSSFNVTFGTYGAAAGMGAPGLGASGSSAFGSSASGVAGIMAALSQGIEGLAGSIGAIVGDATHITGPDGREYQVDQEEMQRLARALTSGDVAEQMAAKKQLHRIRAAAMAQVARQAADGTLGQAGGAIGHAGAGRAGAGLAGAGLAGAAGGGSVEDRLAKLEDLLSKGILTQSEYDTQRQRIIEEI